MLEQILDYIHNYFVKDIHVGRFVIESGSLVGADDILQNNQYYKVVGSVFNDGVYKYPVDSLVDEEFTGEVWALAIPKAVLNISEEIDDWMDKYGSAVSSPYQSESFGGYSYTKGDAIGSNGEAGWQSVFASRLNHWRKIS